MIIVTFRSVRGREATYTSPAIDEGNGEEVRAVRRLARRTAGRIDKWRTRRLAWVVSPSRRVASRDRRRGNIVRRARERAYVSRAIEMRKVRRDFLHMHVRPVHKYSPPPPPRSQTVPMHIGVYKKALAIDRDFEPNDCDIEKMD